MGVYVKGMEMPTEKKSITIFPDGRVYENHGDRLWGQGKDCIHWKAVPVPAHGDLIDRDELKRHAMPFNRFDDDEQFVYLDDIDAAPTIVPAEEETT